MAEVPTVMVVVAAALVRSDGRVLMQKRRFGSFHGGLWEFPGGKVEPRESPESALSRELGEELDIVVPLTALVPCGFACDFANPDLTSKPIVILFYTCRDWSGEPDCLEGEAIGWFDMAEVRELAMPPLDVPLAGLLEKQMQKGLI